MLGQAVGRDQEAMARDTHDNIWSAGRCQPIESDYMIE